MDFSTWYTDTVDCYRVESFTEGHLTRRERREVFRGVRGRLFRHKGGGLRMQQTAAVTEGTESLMCALGVDIQAGDELFIHRGGALGTPRETLRAFADEPHHYVEPFGAVMPGLAHQEIDLLHREYVRGGTEYDPA